MKNDIWKEVYATRITPEKEIEIQKNLLTYEGSEIFQIGTMSSIVGPAKSRKTFCMSLLLEEMITPTGVGFEGKFSGEILYIDTEQSDRRLQMVSKRFTRPELFTFLPVRQYSIKDRYEIIEEGIARLRPELVVIDGYKELTMDINDQTYSTKLMNKLLQWTTEHKTHITGVLHTNPESVKPRGALGTELMNKCSSILRTEARGGATRVSCLVSRDKEFSPFSFTIDENNKPKKK